MSQLWRQILHDDTQLAASDLAIVNEVTHDGLRHIAGDGKTNTDIAAVGSDDRRVDTDQFALHVDQCATGITGVDRGVGLNKIFKSFDTQAGTS